MRIAKIAAAGLLLCALPNPAMADDWYGDEYRPCGQQATTVAIVDCVAGLYESWDGKLNTAYGDAMSHLAPERAAALRDVQRAWLAYRDANCAFYRTGEGTIASIEAATCMFALTRDRARELETMQQH